ncbi:MAG: enoyl-CoA hydratase [Desulfuromonadaceae bacterium]|nr:enoyl-CoA hydratase [Desulfuromonadaceae bacterium]MDD5104478.1 enoyl-CoA hydratase [Desulfuromonadaceae bacterium]
MNGHLITTELQDGILTVQINRPEKKNALNTAMYGALADALLRADAEPAIRVVLLCGAGDCFTSGNDIADFINFPPTGPDSPVLRFLNAITATVKPLIAAVSGPAIGVGTTLLLHCDLVYASDTATFQMPFVSLGLCPEAGSTLLLPQLIGHQRASELLLLGNSFTAMRAEQLGIVTMMVPQAELMQTARCKALQLAAQPAAAVRMTKSLLKRGTLDKLQETGLFEIGCFLERLSSPEAKEALQAFMERRKPDFSQFD